MKTPRFGLTAKGELLLIVAIYGFRRKRKTAPGGRSFNEDYEINRF